MSQWQTFPFSNFAGLDLTSSPDGSACIDMLNVDLDQRGAVRTRDGYTLKYTFTGAGTTVSQGSFLMGFSPTAFNQLVCIVYGGTEARVEILDRDYATVASNKLGNSFFQTAVEFQGYAYITGDDPGVDLVRWDGTSFSVPGGTPVVKHLAVQSPDNRLVGGNYSTTPAPSRVGFSNAGNPTTWGATDFVDITPGDGEEIYALCSWREYVFAFKRTKFAVFYGNSVDATGEAVFNYRLINTGQGVSSSYGPIAVAPEGVYFGNPTGIYFTTGGAPVKISGVLDRWIQGHSTPFFQGGVWSPYGPQKMAYVNGRLYAFFWDIDSTTDPFTLVYDPATRDWMYWNTPAGAACGWGELGDTREFHFLSGLGSAAAPKLYKMTPGDADDAGSAITSRYRTGFYDLGAQEEKRTRQMKVWGTGSPNLKMSRDFGSLDTARGLTLGTSPAVGRDTTACSKDGEVFSHEFSASSGLWTVHRAATSFMPIRPPGSNTP